MNKRIIFAGIVILFFLFLIDRIQAKDSFLSLKNSNQNSFGANGLQAIGETNPIFFIQEDNLLGYDSSQKDARLSPFDQKRLKSPTKAFIIAAIPGFFVHGLGHFYAKKPKTGKILLGIEGAAVLLTTYGWIGAYSFSWFDEEAKEKRKIGKVLFYSGITLFAGSWVYDMIAAPSQAKTHNKKIIERYELSLKLQPQKNEIKLILTTNF